MEQHVDIIDRHGRKRRARKGETLRDGERFSLPMQFMDATAREVVDHLAAKYGHPAPAADAAVITDAAGAMAGHRPGFLYSNADCATLADAETTTAYEARNQRLSSAWKRKPNELPAPGEQETAWLRRQALARKAAEATMGKDAASTLDQARAAAEQAWRDRNTRMSNAWRNRDA